MDPTEYNRSAWNSIARSKRKWFLPANESQIANARNGRVDIAVTATKNVPKEWLTDVSGKKILCLAAGGGHQGPILSAAGADVTVADFSLGQLEIDKKVASQFDLQLATIQCDMRQLGEIGTFDLVVNPCSTNFCSDVKRVWSEAYRVLRPGGELIAGVINPINYLFDESAMLNGKFVVKHPIPYQTPSPTENLNEKERDDGESNPSPIEFGHTLDDLLGEQCRVGFHVVDFFEDRWGSGDLLSKKIDVFIATRAQKRD